MKGARGSAAIQFLIVCIIVFFKTEFVQNCSVQTKHLTGKFGILHHGKGSLCDHREKTNGSSDKSMGSWVLLYSGKLGLSIALGYDQNYSGYIFVWFCFFKELFLQGDAPGGKSSNLGYIKTNKVNGCCDVRGKNFTFSFHSEKLEMFCNKVA